MPHLDSGHQNEWESSCSPSITSDVLWKLDAYRLALYLLHLARTDCKALQRSRAGSAIASQLLRAAGSISANLGEGYSRSTRTDRIRFLSYSLGSTRECISWYEASRALIPELLVDERLALLARIRALLLGLIRALRDAKETPARFER